MWIGPRERRMLLVDVGFLVLMMCRSVMEGRCLLGLLSLIWVAVVVVFIF